MRYAAGQTVSKGFYWNSSTGEELKVAEDEKKVLPGKAGDKYFKLPAGGMLVVGPLLGFGLVVFLPVIGILMTAQVAVEAIAHQLKRAATAMGHVATPAEMMGEAALTKKDKDDEDQAGKVEDETLANEVKARRDEGEK